MNRRLELLAERYAICRLPADSKLAAWPAGEFVSITRTADELSIVCEASQAPRGSTCSTGWRCLKLVGPFALDEVAVLAPLAACLAEQTISVFAIATYDTDYLLVAEAQLAEAVAALRDQGHEVVGQHG